MKHLIPNEARLQLSTTRLTLEPITETHTKELWELFKDPNLHHYVPFEPLSLEKQKERCQRWAKRHSPDEKEIWLNWAAREHSTKKVIAHFQAGISQPGTATIGYLVARANQNQGIAAEGLKAVFNFLQEVMSIKEIKAYSDTRNKASHRLAEKLGMKQIELIKDADFFKGQSSDEFVFSISLR